MALKIELREQGDFLFRHRSYLPLVVLVIGLVLYIHMIMEGTGLEDRSRRIYELVCFGVCLLGLAIRFVTIGYTADNTSGRNTTVGQVADSINQTGPYAICRHPLYVGNFFMWLGLAAFTQNGWFLAAFVFMYWVYYERIMYAEEAYLIDKYGDDYLTYSKGVPAFVPRFGQWVTPKYSFSFRKIIRQEKAGILNMFLVVVLFRGAGEYFAGNEWAVEDYWIFGLVAAIVWYIIIKIVQKTTTWLAEDR